MLKIGDFSRLSRVSVKALRYYDELGLLKPVSVNRFTGYRYYSADQLPKLNRIIGLKNLGLSLEEVAQLLTDNLSSEQIMGLLHDKRAEIRKRMHDEQRRLERVEEWLKQFEKEGTMPSYDVVMKKVSPQGVASLRDIVPTYADITRLFEELCPYLEKHEAKWVGPPLAIYYDCEYKEKDVDMEVAVPIQGDLPATERIKVGELPGIEQTACIIYQGPYEKIHEAYFFMMKWLEENGYEITGPDREVYLVGPGQAADSTGYVTELQFPVVKK